MYDSIVNEVSDMKNMILNFLNSNIIADFLFIVLRISVVLDALLFFLGFFLAGKISENFLNKFASLVFVGFWVYFISELYFILGYIVNYRLYLFFPKLYH